MEKKLGGGRVVSQKQFLDNDRKVLVFFTNSGDNQYVFNYFLADDTVEIRECHFANDGRDSFAVYLRRQKLPETFSVNQPEGHDMHRVRSGLDPSPGGRYSPAGHFLHS